VLSLGTRALCAATLFFSFTGPARADRHITPPATSARAHAEGLGGRIGSLRGTVRNALGEVVGGAVVTLTGNVERTARTDSTGSFSFVGLAPGSYSIHLESSDTPSPAQSIEIGSRESIVSLTLGRSSTSLVTIGRTGTGSAHLASNAAVATQTLSASAAAARGETSVAEMLEHDARSVTIVRPVGGNGPIAVALRGPDPTETLVDVDGHALNSGGSGSFDVSLLDPAELASVQLVYGIAPSSLVGPNTIGGVINVRTLEPTAKAHGLLRLSTDSFGSIGQTLQATGTSQRLGYAFSLHRTTSGGEVHDPTLISEPGTTSHVGSTIVGSDALAKLRYTFGNADGFFAFTFRDQSTYRDLSAALTSVGGPNLSYRSFAGSALQGHNAGYGFDVQTPLGSTRDGEGTRSIVLFRHFTSLSTQSVVGPAAGSSPYLFDTVDRLGEDSLQIDRVFSKAVVSIKLTARSEQLATQQIAGGDSVVDQTYLRRALATDPQSSASSYPDRLRQVQRWGVVRAAFDPSSTLHATLAAYYSDFSSFGTSIDPRFGLVWTPTLQNALRFSVGSTFQSPQLPELYVPARLPAPDSSGAVNIGNPNLKADHATEIELGFEHVFEAADPTRLGIDLYRTNLRAPAQRRYAAANCAGSAAA
jgi:outer membrane receptor protein involved in Fe transport